MSTDAKSFDPSNVNLDAIDAAQVVCYLTGVKDASPEETTRLGLRITAIFVVLITSSFCVFFPVVAAQVRWLSIPQAVYIFARYFGAGVLVATAFIHLLDPAYRAIGPDTCVGLTGRWAGYSWVPGIVLASVIAIFLIDFIAETIVESKWGLAHGPISALADPGSQTDQDKQCERVSALGVESLPSTRSQMPINSASHRDHDHRTHQFLHSGDQDIAVTLAHVDSECAREYDVDEKKMEGMDRLFYQQIFAFYILEIGVIVHSVIIGLNLGVAEEEFSVLFPVITVHQSFEGLGIGARLSTIPFPQRHKWLQWACCIAYGVTTPIAIAIGVGLRSVYAADSFTAKAVSGLLDAVSAGILIYSSLVELLARDFLFNPERTKDKKQLLLMISYLILGALLMALLGKWA